VRLYLFILIFFIVEEEGVEVKVFFFSFIGHVQRGGEGAYTYNLATTPAGTGAGGCLTAKKGA
jgi:hypothetical protein